jgi:DNA modification methylase
MSSFQAPRNRLIPLERCAQHTYAFGNLRPDVPAKDELEVKRKVVTRSRGSHPARLRALSPNKIYLGDARQLVPVLDADSIDVTITSPPYFDMKDYGERNQIGFGQDYETYLTDLQGVFGHVLRATKTRGTLWIVIDTFRRNHEVYPLPFDVAARLKKVGWVLRDIIIWKKERTVPWAKAGSTRKIFEYILVFAKSSADFNFYADKERDSRDLKRWWVKYPERYNPKGKALEEIWTFDIPTQGSWGKKFIRHFCPMPASLVSRIIRLTTKPGELVFDPFAGTGTVPSRAKAEGREFLGIELNKKYIAKFETFLKAQSKNIEKKPARSRTKFESAVLDLRILKFARLLYRLAEKSASKGSETRVFVCRSRTRPLERHKICTADIYVLLGRGADKEKINRLFTSRIKIPPLSKFGIAANIRFVRATSGLPRVFQRERLYCYTSTNSYRYSGQTQIAGPQALKYPVLSPIRADIEVPDE